MLPSLFATYDGMRWKRARDGVVVMASYRLAPYIVNSTLEWFQLARSACALYISPVLDPLRYIFLLEHCSLNSGSFYWFKSFGKLPRKKNRYILSVCSFVIELKATFHLKCEEIELKWKTFVIMKENLLIRFIWTQRQQQYTPHRMDLTQSHRGLITIILSCHSISLIMINFNVVSGH